MILAGDFNVMPTELDVYAPERCVDDAPLRPEVRDAYRRLVRQGWTDALRALHPNERIYTFWKYFRNAFARDTGLRIDHLLLSPAVASRLVAAGVAAAGSQRSVKASSASRRAETSLRQRSRLRSEKTPAGGAGVRSGERSTFGGLRSSVNQRCPSG